MHSESLQIPSKRLSLFGNKPPQSVAMGVQTPKILELCTFQILVFHYLSPWTLRGCFIPKTSSFWSTIATLKHKGADTWTQSAMLPHSKGLHYHWVYLGRTLHATDGCCLEVVWFLPPEPAEPRNNINEGSSRTSQIMAISQTRQNCQVVGDC